MVIKLEKQQIDRTYQTHCFLDPDFSRVGLNIKEAKVKWYDVLVAKMAIEAIQRAKQIGRTEGFIKIVIDKDSEKILGVTIICDGSSEIIHLIQLAIDMASNILI